MITPLDFPGPLWHPFVVLGDGVGHVLGRNFGSDGADVDARGRLIQDLA